MPKKSRPRDPESLKRLLHRRQHTPASHVVGDSLDPEPDSPPDPRPSGEKSESLPVSTTLILSTDAWKRLAVYSFVQNRTLRDVLEEVVRHLDVLEDEEIRAVEGTRKTRRINALLAEEIHDRLRLQAVVRNTTMNSLVEALIRKVLPEPDPELASAIRRLPRGPKPRR